MGGNRETSLHLGASELSLSHRARNRARNGVFLAIAACLALAASPGFAAGDSVGPQYSPALPSASGHSSPGDENIALPEQAKNKGGASQGSDTNPVSEEASVDSGTRTPNGEERSTKQDGSRAGDGESEIEGVLSWAEVRDAASDTAAKRHPPDDGGGEFPWLPLMFAGVALAAIVSLLRLRFRRRRSDGDQPAPGPAR